MTVSVKAAVPAVTETGLRVEMTGVGTLIGSATATDALPPVLIAVMLALPALAIRLAGTAAVNCVELTNVVANAVPFQRTAAPERKLVPFTVRVNAGPPAIAEVGLKPVIVGVGALTGNGADADGFPPALSAVMLTLLALAIRLAGTDAVS